MCGEGKRIFSTEKWRMERTGALEQSFKDRNLKFGNFEWPMMATRNLGALQ